MVGKKGAEFLAAKAVDLELENRLTNDIVSGGENME